MKTIYTVLSAFVLSMSMYAQPTTVWADPITQFSNWQTNIPIGPNTSTDQWVIDDVEGGVPAGNCQQFLNGDATIHVTNMMVFGGAIYNPQSLSNMRIAHASDISTVGYPNFLMLNFDFIAGGIPGADFCEVMYSTDGGTTYNSLGILGQVANCGNQKIWTPQMYLLPMACSNIPNLRLAFDWHANGDGLGTQPSVAINNITITTQTMTGIAQSLVEVPAIFSHDNTITVGTGEDFNVVSFTDLTGRQIAYERSDNRIIRQGNLPGICFLTIEYKGLVITRKLFVE